MAVPVAAALQIFGDVGGAPRFQPAARGAVEPGREHALDHAAPERLVLLFGAERVLRRVAGAAMGEGFDEVATAIPVRTLALVRLDDSRREEQCVPGAHQHAIVERPAQLRRRRLVVDRRQRREIGADRQDVVADQFREIRVREGRVIMRPVR